ncbi:hypothetical protein BKA83DRAFT_4129249 [Pisolithus microcarpus]|nr:hypothetical protein BKA83DRAFT_4129249 [Pisolithus microcarpus]
MSVSTDKVPLRKSCIYLIKVDNSGYLEGVVCPSYFYYPVPECLLTHLQGPSRFGYATAMGVVHLTDAPMTFQTTLFSDRSGRSSNNVLVPQSTPRHIATPT